MANSEGSDDMLNRVMPKDNIGLAALLKTKEAAWDNCKYTYWTETYCKSISFVVRESNVDINATYTQMYELLLVDIVTSATVVDSIIKEYCMRNGPEQ